MTKLRTYTLWDELKPKSVPTLWPETLMDPKDSTADKEKLIPVRQGLQFFGQSFCTKLGENIYIGSS